MKIKKHPSSIDIYVIIATFFIVVLCVFIIISLLINFSLFNIIPILIVIASVLFALFLFPINYIITDENIIIRRLFSNKNISLKKIIHIQHIKNTIPYSYSSKGVFGYLGKTMDGTVSYSTSLKNNILIKTSNLGGFIISPKNIESFICDIKKHNNVV